MTQDSDPPVSPPPPPEVKKTQFYLTQLVVLTILIIGLILIVAAYPRLRPRFEALVRVTVPTAHPSATASPTLTPSITPSPTPTLRSTLTPTISLTPSPTGTLPATFTPPGPPTLTPAIPVADSSVYSLTDWSPESADLTALYMEDYPNTLSEKSRGENDAGYWAAYTYAVTALQEAVLRYADDPKAGDWNWRLAKSMARSGDVDAVEVYANLIAGGLNRGNTTLDELPDWFHTQDPDLDLFTIETGPLEAYLGSYLLQLDGRGSAFIHLLEGSGAYTALPLFDGFNFANPVSSQVVLGDLTGDGKEEAVRFYSNEGALALRESNGPLIPKPVLGFTVPQVFDLSEPPAMELPFDVGEDQTTLGIEFLNRWSITENPSGQNRLVFDGQTFPACPVTIHFEYEWGGEAFQRMETAYLIDPAVSDVPRCHVIVDHAAEQWGPQAAIELMEALLPYFEPVTPAPGKTLTPEDEANAKDEWLYRLGVYHALVGNVDEAQSYFKQINERDPAAPPPLTDRQWNAPAESFLNQYKTADDVYQACLDAPFCNPSEALAYLGRHLPERSKGDALAHLTTLGVKLISSGYADFDQDGTSERWFTTRHRALEKPELWIITETRTENLTIPQAVLVGELESGKAEWDILEGENGEAVVQLDAVRYFTLARHPETKDPVIVWLEPPYLLPPAATMPNRFNQELLLAESGLLSGEDPREIQKKLLALEDFPGLLCKATWTCDRYYYLLGLASELAGDEQQAVKAYVRLWSEYTRSPFTTMARLKLLGTAISVATPTPAQVTPTEVTPAPGTTPLPTATPSGPYPPIDTPYPPINTPYP